MVAKTWKTLSKETIVNCFSHPGRTFDNMFLSEGQTPVCDDAYTELERVVNIFEYSCRTEEFVNVNNNFLICEELTDNDIVGNVTADDHEEGNEDEEEVFGKSSTASKLMSPARLFLRIY